MHLYAPNRTALHVVEKPHQAVNLIAHDEVREGEFWSWPFVRIQLHVSQRHRPRIEYGLGMSHLQVFDAAVVDGLAQAHQGLARRR